MRKGEKKVLWGFLYVLIFLAVFALSAVFKITYNPLNEDTSQEENCEHVFMPIDSTGEVLSCRNCGLVVKREDLKDINFFRKHD